CEQTAFLLGNASDLLLEFLTSRAEFVLGRKPGKGSFRFVKLKFQIFETGYIARVDSVEEPDFRIGHKLAKIETLGALRDTPRAPATFGTALGLCNFESVVVKAKLVGQESLLLGYIAEAPAQRFHTRKRFQSEIPSPIGFAACRLDTSEV